MREAVLRDLAVRAASDRAFLSDLRRDPRGTLDAHGYALAEEELAMVLDLRRRTAALGDGTVASLLAGGLEGRTGVPPGRPRAPGRAVAGPTRPLSPGRSDGRERRRET